MPTSATASPNGPNADPTDPGTTAQPDDEQQRIVARARIVAAGTLVSRILGLGREVVLAGMFSRAVTDAFMVAFTIPNMLRQLLAEGAVQSSVLPVLAKTLEKEGEDQAREYFRHVRALSLLILALVSVAGCLAAPWLVDLFAHGARQHAGQFERTVTLTRWLFPYILFMGSAALGLAALNANHRFTVTAFAPGLLNVAFIGCGLWLPSYFAAHQIDPMMALAAGVLLGGVLQVVAQWPSLKRIGYTVLPKLSLSDPRVRETLLRMGPVLIGMGVYAADLVLARRFLSEFEIGAQSYFGFAQRLVDFPQGIFVMALQAATLPSLAKLAARNDRVELGRTFAYSLKLSLFVGVVGSVLFVSLAQPVVALLFQRGQFDAQATLGTTRALMAQGAGIWCVAVVRQLLSLYYAVGDTRTPVIVSMLDLGAFVVLALILRGDLGHVGVSWAVSGASLVQALLLVFFMRRHIDLNFLPDLLRSLLKTCLSLLPAGLAGYWIGVLLLPAGLGTALPGLLALTAFGVLFLASAWLLRSEELLGLLGPLAKRLRS
ncbi:MAG TPA: murein biosynthesis integral membrane protein MurJ [Polyangiaceae bacterium]|nr:murein biosynthesis integral membrane protein MurJ [Polyangiaceae bacterium]